MTLYWWMHWFWITSWIMIIIAHFPCESLLTTSVHSISTDLPVLHSSTLLIGTTKSQDNESITPPPITLSRSTEQRNVTVTQNVSTNSLIKKDILNFSNVTTKLNTTKTQQHRMLSVINQLNSTENTNAIWMNNSTNAINDMENLTYVRREDMLNKDLKPVIEEIDKPVPDSSEINLSAAGITGITLGCIICIAIICGISFFLYQNHGFNKPQVLNDRCSNPDSSGYIDDASVRDNSEEMYSLDNDSFLNSLEAMTIQNYWTDTVKHTKL